MGWEKKKPLLNHGRKFSDEDTYWDSERRKKGKKGLDHSSTAAVLSKGQGKNSGKDLSIVTPGGGTG